jgi:hypothetical protein
VPNGKFTGPVKFVYAGDVAKAKTLSGYARTLIGNVSSMTSLGDVSSGWQKSTTPEGAVILVNTQSADPVAHIYYPPGGGKKGEGIKYHYAVMPRKGVSIMDPISLPPVGHGISEVHPHAFIHQPHGRVKPYAYHSYRDQIPRSGGGPFYGYNYHVDTKGRCLQWQTDQRYRPYTGTAFATMDGYIVAAMNVTTYGPVCAAWILKGHLFVATRREAVVPQPPYHSLLGDEISGYVKNDVYIFAAPYPTTRQGKPHLRLTQSDFTLVHHTDMTGYDRDTQLVKYLPAVSDLGKYALAYPMPDKAIVVNKHGTEATVISTYTTLQEHFEDSLGNKRYWPRHAMFYKHKYELDVVDGTPTCNYSVEELDYAGTLFESETTPGNVHYAHAIPSDSEIPGLAGKVSRTILAYDYDHETDELVYLELDYKTESNALFPRSPLSVNTNRSAGGFFDRPYIQFKDARWSVHDPVGENSSTWRAVAAMDLRYGLFMFLNINAGGSYFTIERYEEDALVEKARVPINDQKSITTYGGAIELDPSTPDGIIGLRTESVRINPIRIDGPVQELGVPAYRPWAREMAVIDRGRFAFNWTMYGSGYTTLPTPPGVDVFTFSFARIVEIFDEDNTTDMVSPDKIFGLVGPDEDDPVATGVGIGAFTLIRDPDNENKSV